MKNLTLITILILTFITGDTYSQSYFFVANSIVEKKMLFEKAYFKKSLSERIEIEYNFGNDTLLFAFDRDTSDVSGNHNASLLMLSGTYKIDPDSGIYATGSNQYQLINPRITGIKNTDQSHVSGLSIEEDAYWGISYEYWKPDSSVEYRMMQNIGGLTYLGYQTNGAFYLIYNIVGNISHSITSGLGARYKQRWLTENYTRDNRIGKHVFNGIVREDVSKADTNQRLTYSKKTYPLNKGWTRDLKIFLKGTLQEKIFPIDSLTLYYNYGNPEITINNSNKTVTFSYTGADEYQIITAEIKTNLPSEFRSLVNIPFYYDYKILGDAFVCAQIISYNANQEASGTLSALGDTSHIRGYWHYKKIPKATMFNFYRSGITSLNSSYDTNAWEPNDGITIRLYIYIKNGTVNLKNIGIRYLI